MIVGTGPRPEIDSIAETRPRSTQDRRRDPAHEVADLGEGLARLFLALEDELLGRLGIVVDPLAGQAQVDGQHDQALLGAIVEVALDPVQLARFDVQDRRAALPERLDLAPQLAALRRAQEARHDPAVERHQHLRERRSHGQQRGAEHGTKEDDRRSVPRQRPEGPVCDAPATASYQTGLVSSESATIQREPATRNSITDSGRLIAT